MSVSRTPMSLFIVTVKIEINLQCFTESVSLRDLSKPNSRLEITNPNTLHLEAVNGAQLGSALTGATGELTKRPVQPVSWHRHRWVRRNSQMMYLYLGGSVPMQQSLRLFDGADPTYTTEDFLNTITEKW